MKDTSTIFFILSLFFVSTAQAAEGFFLEAELSKLPAQENILKKAYGKTLQMGEGERCTVIPVGQDIGLTALHCLQNKVPFKGVGFSDRAGLIFNAEPQDSEMIIATGGRFPKFFETMIDPGVWTARDKEQYMQAYLSDWALIKFPTKNIEPFCLNLNAVGSFSENIFAIGFPMRAVRMQHSSDGKDKFISYGKIARDLRLNSYINSLPLKTKDLHLELLQPPIDQQKLLFLDIDVRPGNSGGPVVDDQGSLVGIVTAGFSSSPITNEFHYIPHVGIAISMQQIMRDLRSQNVDVQKYFQCMRGGK